MYDEYYYFMTLCYRSIERYMYYKAFKIIDIGINFYFGLIFESIVLIIIPYSYCGN